MLCDTKKGLKMSKTIDVGTTEETDTIVICAYFKFGARKIVVQRMIIVNAIN